MTRFRLAAPGAMAAILLFAGRLGAQEPASDGVLSGGDLSAKLRYRVESVEQEGPLRSALASTLRTSVAFETNPELSGGVLVELEDVHAIGTEKYNSTTNGRTAYSVVPDPEGAELNQAYVSWHRPGIRARIGRQSIVLDNARFIGDAGFRQNQQTFDALTLQATTPGGSRFSYGYLARARRFLGDDHPLGDVDLRTHLLNYSFGRLNGDRLTAYAYLVEFDHAALRASSSQSLGASYDGSVDVGTRKFLYRAEYARQSEYADSPGRADAWYGNVEAGLRFAGQWTVGIGAEFLSGDGTDAFQTPLGTLHKFNGAADLFATATPADGLQDSYARVYVPIAGLRLTVTGHDFRSDNASRDYGRELDAEIEWRVNKHWQIGMKFASYEAETFGTDTRKGWAWVQGDF